MPRNKKVVTAAQIAELIVYNPDTGTFTYKARSGEDRATSRFNTQYAGRTAGHIGDKGYVSVSLRNVGYAAHQLAFLLMTGSWPTKAVDHIDGNKTNNAWNNLREVTVQQNATNRALPAKTRSRVVGVNWNPKREKWIARITVSGRTIYLGEFTELVDATATRKAAERSYGFLSANGAL